MKKSEVFNFRLDPLEAVQVKRFARSHGLSFTELCRGAVFQVIWEAKDQGGYLDLPDELPEGGDRENDF